VQQQAELVGKEAVAAKAVGLQRPPEVLDPPLRLTPSHVPTVELLQLVETTGDHKVRVRALLQHLRLVDHPPGALPATGPVAGSVGNEPHLLPVPCLGLPLGPLEQGLGQRLEPGVGDEAHRVADAVLFTVLVEGGHRERRVRPDLNSNLHPGLLFPEPPHGAL